MAILTCCNDTGIVACITACFAAGSKSFLIKINWNNFEQTSHSKHVLLERAMDEDFEISFIFKILDKYK